MYGRGDSRKRRRMHSAEGSIVEQFAANIIFLIVNVPIDRLSSQLRTKLHNILMEKNSLNLILKAAS